MKRFIAILLLIIIAGFLLAPRFSSDTRWYETQGQRHWFVTTSGTGNCLSWSNACSFRTAVSKCTDDVQDVIWLGPGDHDTDNGVDATGTTISAKNVRIVGSGGYRNLNSSLMNSAASVTNVLIVTGDKFYIENVRFDQTGQTDVDAILLTLSSDRSSVVTCYFESANGATDDTGVLIDSASDDSYFENIHFENFQTVAMKTNGCHNFEARKLKFRDNVLGLNIAGGANDHDISISDSQWISNTLAAQTSAGSYNINFNNPLGEWNTTDMVDNSNYDGVRIVHPSASMGKLLTYPANAGVTVTGGAGAWAQGAIAQIVPASTITTPFFITGINIQDATASNTYKLEILYGEAAGDNSLGIYEFTAANPKTPVVPIDILQEMIPSNSYVGAKLASDSGGGDTAVITINYLAF